MLTEIHPKLPMRDKKITRDFYLNKLGFTIAGGDYDGYLMIKRDGIQIHFFEFRDVNPAENYGQVYIRTDDIKGFYEMAKKAGADVTTLESKPWGQQEFSIHDPDNNLLTVGQSM
jgi:catechol 2,3-dioxygenase-like lactoylglutathione lyase family enzyme